MAAEREVYQRVDKKWAWRLWSNGRIIATDHGQGYENESDCTAMADRIIGGEFRGAGKARVPLKE